MIRQAVSDCNLLTISFTLIFLKMPRNLQFSRLIIDFVLCSPARKEERPDEIAKLCRPRILEGEGNYAAKESKTFPRSMEYLRIQRFRKFSTSSCHILSQATVYSERWMCSMKFSTPEGSVLCEVYPNFVDNFIENFCDLCDNTLWSYA